MKPKPSSQKKINYPKNRRRATVLLNRLQKAFPAVTKIIEAKAPVIVKVKARDCQSATMGSFADCALARATKREFKADAVLIGLTMSYVIKGDTAIRYMTPDTVKREMVSFDRHGDFDQGTYHLAAVPDSMTLGHKRNTESRHTGENAKHGRHKSKRINSHFSARVRRISGRGGPSL